eukprot:TRINITY_DN1414_c0_g1_i1.p1 TRINITY_DN1414_c0_g1~~TRINITY_DN1414_c0_g1_i1.p1  ORF type:complete len:259 (-),score=11.18 TRINITY_DN1414_c0_g1_i1:36-812(-)
MPIVHGVGDEVLLAAVVALPPVIYLCHSTLGHPIGFLKSGALAVKNLFTSLWWRIRRAHPPEGAPQTPSDSASVRRETSSPMDAPPVGDVCCICHDSFTLPCQANCGHWFCGDCIMSVWAYGRATPACACPMCRRTITLLIPCLSPPVDGSGAIPEDQQETLRKVLRYNRLYGGGPVSIWQRIRDAPLLLRRMAYELRDPHRALRLLYNVRVLLCIAAVLLYVLSPLDILPEGDPAAPAPGFRLLLPPLCTRLATNIM